MRAFRALFSAFVFVMAASGSVVAQDAPNPGEILEAWLASPHAQSSAEAFRHWDDEGEIPGSCAVCHSTTGFAEYVASPMMSAGRIDHPVPTGTTIECASCHAPEALGLASVTYPSGVTMDVSGPSAVCTVCHQGRASTDQVDEAVAELELDLVSPDLGFINIHYAAAAATQLGGEVRGGYQYETRSYVGEFTHIAGFDTCVGCHGPHDTQPQLETCTTCHAGANNFAAIRTTTLDILGTGDTTSGISSVIEELHARLGEAIATYARHINASPVVYSDEAYPYFFSDLNADGVADPSETIFPNRYQRWTPRLLRAAYNYQYVAKDHGAFAHNPHYAIQLLFDSLADLAVVANVDMSGLVRP